MFKNRIAALVGMSLTLVGVTAFSQLQVFVPIQYQGRWAANCRVGWSITIEKKAAGGMEITGVIENLPGHILITANGGQISMFPQPGTNGTQVMMAMTPKGQPQATIGIMNLCWDGMRR